MAAPYTQGGFLSAEYAAGDVSPHSSQHSPRPSAGRSRLNNFVFPSQGSPGLEARVEQMSIASLPAKPSSGAPSSANSRPASGMAFSSALRPLSTSPAGRSDIALRYPPLPSLPTRPATLSAAAELDPSIKEYIGSLRSVIEVYEQRDDLLRLRTEAVGFQPKHAYLAWHSPGTTTDTDGAANPILGVRLLQRLDKLQRENEELGRLLTSTHTTHTSTAAGEGEVESEVAELRREVDECHRLIDAMEAALGRAEARVVTAERALEVACREKSTSILPSTSASEESKATKGAEGAETIKASAGASSAAGAAAGGSDSKPQSTPSRPPARKNKPGGKPPAQRPKPSAGKNEPKSSNKGRTNQAQKSPKPP